MSFQSTNKLPFEVAEWEFPEFIRFRVGTCAGLWASTEASYDILAVTNDEPGNGHFEDVIQWFENSCIRDRKNLRVLEIWNDDFKKHLIEKRGFSIVPMSDNVIKKYKVIKKMLIGAQTAKQS